MKNTRKKKINLSDLIAGAAVFLTLAAIVACVFGDAEDDCSTDF